MKANFVFVPPEGGEADYSLEFEIKAVPNKGDYITIRRPHESGSSDFIVRRRWWHMKHPSTEAYQDPTKKGPCGVVSELIVECEYARSSHSTESHKSCCDAYDKKGPPVQAFDESCF